MNIRYYMIKLGGKILRKSDTKVCEDLVKLFRKQGMEVGEKCRIYSDISTSESYLIHLCDNITISNNVQLITHDNSICKINSEYTDLFGEICIGNNCFIGARTIIMPGVIIGDNCIIGAGSVVVNSVPNECIVAGNPARIVSTYSQMKKKNYDKGFNIDGLTQKQKTKLLHDNKEQFIKRKEIS